MRPVILSLLLLAAALAGCSSAPTFPTLPEAGGTPIVATREPLPTATPDIISQQVDQVTANAGLTGESFLGLPIDDWFDLAASVLIVLLGYLAIRWLLRKGWQWLARLTNPDLVAKAHTRLDVPLRRLVLTFLVYFALARLVFVPGGVRQPLLDLIYIVGLVLTVVVAWRAVDLAADLVRARQTDPQQRVDMEPALVLVVRLIRVMVIGLALTWLLSYFGINVSALVAALGLGGLALSLAARDTIADAIAGVIILFDKPFRTGDRIGIQELQTWGDVVEIGLRTTRIRTPDNRMVIVPNSLINSGQVVNYSYPDPRYRVETMVNVAYGSDVEMVRRVLSEAVRGVEGVLPDKPVDVLYDEMGDSAMVFRLRWWLESYTDTRHMNDKVHTAVQQAIDAHGIVLAFPKQIVQLEGDFPAPSEPPPQAD